MNQRIKRLSKKESIRAMNSMASDKAPFVFLVSFDLKNNIVLKAEEAEKAGFLLEMPEYANGGPVEGPYKTIELEADFPTEEVYGTAFELVRREIHYGNSFLLNLTFPSPIESNYSPGQIFNCSRARYKLLLEDELVVFSPERFVRMAGGKISSNPMKGTLDASLPGAYALLSSDPKEDAEHNTIVDLIRNDLSMVASKVRVRRFKYIEKLRTNQGELLQMSSEISGHLPGNYLENLGDILFSLLPAGSICGAPKKKTLEIISRAENYKRGYYTGVFGYFDGEIFDSAVAIRYIEKSDKGLIFKSGGGITSMSSCEKEYEELKKKVYVPVY